VLDFLPGLADWIRDHLPAIVGGGAVRHMFSARPKDIPVCHTRVMREGRGWPWNHLIGVHPLDDGHVEISPLSERPPGSS